MYLATLIVFLTLFLIGDQAFRKKDFTEAKRIVDEQLRSPNKSAFVAAEDPDGEEIKSFEYRFHKQRRKGLTMLFYAVLYDQNNEMVQLLIEHGAGTVTLVQSFYGLTFNKLQHKCFQVFLVQKNELYNISESLVESDGGKA